MVLMRIPGWALSIFARHTRSQKSHFAHHIGKVFQGCEFTCVMHVEAKYEKGSSVASLKTKTSAGLMQYRFELTGFLLDLISTAMNTLSEFIISAAGHPLSYLMIFLFCAIDGFFPPVPSESLVVALSSLIPSKGMPNPWFLGIVAALGAFVGDNVAYLLGRAIGTDKFAWMRRKRLQHAFAWAGYELRLRPVSLILVARFVPIGRVAVNLVAGATKYPHRRFVFLTCFSSVGWASYSVLIGMLAGQWFKEHHLLGMVVAVIVAVAIGVLIDRIVSKVSGNTSLRK